MSWTSIKSKALKHTQSLDLKVKKMKKRKMKKASNKHKHCAGNFFGWQVEQDQTCLMEQV